jgi:hypothetical protein
VGVSGDRYSAFGPGKEALLIPKEDLPRIWVLWEMLNELSP